MSDLFAETDEALRRERLEKFWKDYGKYVLAGLAFIVVLTGIVSGFKSWNQSVNARQTDQLFTALDTQDPQALVKLGEDLRPGLRGIALLSAAQKLLTDKKQEEALAAYQQAAADRSLPSDLREMAVLASISLQDEKNLNEDTLKSLKPIWSNDNSPWRYHARLQAGVVLAAQQDYAAALEHVNIVVDAKDIPESLTNKARALKEVYSLKQKDNPPASEG